MARYSEIDSLWGTLHSIICSSHAATKSFPSDLLSSLTFSIVNIHDKPHIGINPETMLALGGQFVMLTSKGMNTVSWDVKITKSPYHSQLASVPHVVTVRKLHSFFYPYTLLITSSKCPRQQNKTKTVIRWPESKVFNSDKTGSVNFSFFFSWHRSLLDY